MTTPAHHAVAWGTLSGLFWGTLLGLVFLFPLAPIAGAQAVSWARPSELPETSG